MEENKRPGKKDYYLEIAKAVAQRSTCLRRQYGAIIVKDDQIISTGYNGAARGEENCCDVGECWRQSHGIPHGEQYEKCVAVHAEANAILSADRAAMIGSTLYLAGFENGRLIKAEPCAMCARLIKNARIAEVVCTEPNATSKQFGFTRFNRWILCKIREPNGNADNLLQYPVYLEKTAKNETGVFVAFAKIDDAHLLVLMDLNFFIFLKNKEVDPFETEVTIDLPDEITIGWDTYHRFIRCVTD